MTACRGSAAAAPSGSSIGQRAGFTIACALDPTAADLASRDEAVTSAAASERLKNFID